MSQSEPVFNLKPCPFCERKAPHTVPQINNASSRELTERALKCIERLRPAVTHSFDAFELAFCAGELAVIQQCIDSLKAENATLKKQVIELSAAVSDEEWGSVYGYGRVVKRAEVDSLIQERIIRARAVKAEAGQ